MTKSNLVARWRRRSEVTSPIDVATPASANQENGVDISKLTASIFPNSTVFGKIKKNSLDRERSRPEMSASAITTSY